jgi:hypothetical protein
LKEFQACNARLQSGEWADNLAVQGVADMLNINIQVLNTISPDWMHDIHPRNQRSDNTITKGLIGELHYVALEKMSPQTKSEGSVNIQRQRKYKEDEIAFQQTNKLRGIPYDTLLQEEQYADGDNTYSVAPGENQNPCAFLLDDNYEELANPERTEDTEKRRTTIMPRSKSRSIEQRRKQRKESRKRLRMEETPEDSEKRLASDGQRKQGSREKEAPEDTEKRKISDRQSKQRNREARRSNVPTIAKDAEVFKSKVAEGPDYACCLATDVCTSNLSLK